MTSPGRTAEKMPSPSAALPLVSSMPYDLYSIRWKMAAASAYVFSLLTVSRSISFSACGSSVSRAASRVFSRFWMVARSRFWRALTDAILSPVTSFFIICRARCVTLFRASVHFSTFAASLTSATSIPSACATSSIESFVLIYRRKADRRGERGDIGRFFLFIVVSILVRPLRRISSRPFMSLYALLPRICTKKTLFFSLFPLFFTL